MSTFEIIERPVLAEPVLVLALDGWIDAGFAAQQARERLLRSIGPRTVASFDTDVLLDYRSRRPVAHLRNGVNHGLTWPTIELVRGHDGEGRDLLVLTGAEPDHAWRRFTDDVVRLAVDLGVRLVCGLGAYPAPVPHTRPSRLVATATDDDLAARVGYVAAAIDVPAGVHAAIEERCRVVGVPAVGLWAQVPHYAAAMPYPPAAALLVDGLAEVAGLSLDPGPLRDAARVTRARLDEAVAASPEHTAIVRQLEASYDGTPGAVGPLEGDLPTGEEIAAELERFLREQAAGDDRGERGDGPDGD